MADPINFRGPNFGGGMPPKASERKGCTVTHIIINAVLICDCSAKIVLLAAFADPVECPACKQKWQLKQLKFDRTPDPVNPEIQKGALGYAFEAINRVTLEPGRPS